MVTKKVGDNGHKQGRKRDLSNLGGVVKFVGQSQLPQEFLTIGKDFEEALGRCVLRDDWQRNCVILYKHQLELFGLWTRIQTLTSWLNASAAVGGFNRSLAAMTYTGIYVPEGAGIKSSKEERESLMELQRLRARGNQEGEGRNKNNSSP